MTASPVASVGLDLDLVELAALGDAGSTCAPTMRTGADRRLEDRPRRQPVLDALPTDLDERVDERVRPRVAQVVAVDAEQARVRPDRDVDDHQAAPHQGQDVDDRAPAPELEPRALVRPAPASGRRARRDCTGSTRCRSSRSPRWRCRSRSRPRSRRTGWRPARRPRWPRWPGVWNVELTWPHAPPSGSRRSRPIENIRRTVGALDGQRADVDRDEDDHQVQLADRDAADGRRSGSP